MKPKVSIVIPTYNYEQFLIECLNSVIECSMKNYEIIIVDDSSTDGSDLILKKLKKKYNKFNFFIRKKKPRDLSKSCTFGFSKAKFNMVMVMDGDLQHRPEEINKLYKKSQNKNFDIVVGNRGLLERKNYGLGTIRLISSVVLIFTVNFLLGLKTKDPMSGFFIFKKKIYTNNKNRLFNKGYKILLDLIYSSKEKLKIVDVYINFKNRSKGLSKMSTKIIYLLLILLLRNFLKKIF